MASGLVSKFNGSNLVSREIYTQLPFLAAVALGAAATVLLASRLGLPFSTALGNPAKDAGFPYFHSAGGEGFILKGQRKKKQNRKDPFRIPVDRCRSLRPP